MYTFYGHDRVLLVQFVHEIEQQADVGFQKNQSFLHVMLSMDNRKTG